MAKKVKKVAEPKAIFTLPVREVYIHKYVGKIQPVDVAVFIDYRKGIIALIDGTSDMNTPLSVKKWVFADRGIEYMAGWCDILDAMKEAVLVAKDKLNVYQKERELEEAMMMQKVAEHLAK
jgi:hypothetical protein